MIAPHKRSGNAPPSSTASVATPTNSWASVATGWARRCASEDSSITTAWPFWLRIHPALLEAHYGIPLAGGVLVALNTRLTSDDIEYILDDCGAKTLLVDAELKELVDPIDLGDIETVVIEDTGESDDPYEELLAEGSSDWVPDPLEDENEPISINYTSGTTGRPKGAIYTHRGAYLRALGAALEIRLGYDSVHLWTLPMFHCNGWCLTWAVTAAGGVHVCLRKVQPELIWDLFESEGVTHYSGAPTIHMSIVGHDKAHSSSSG